MGRKRKLWTAKTGGYGETVRIREARVGGPLRWDYRHRGKRVRDELYPRTYVRRSADEPPDPVLARHAETLLKREHARVYPTEPARRRNIVAEELTLSGAFALYFEPRREALPKSRSGRKHHGDSRAFWTKELASEEEPDPLWNSIPPADVWGALLRLRQRGQVQTATKRLQNLRTLTRWLQQKMRIRGLEDPTLGLDVKELREGYRPRRPRLAPEQTQALRRVLPNTSWRTRLFFTLLISSGTRGGQARCAMRSGLDGPLEPAPPRGLAPHGWMLFSAMKGQKRHLTHLTLRQRLQITRVIWKRWDGAAWVDGPLAEWERAYQAGEIEDYPLIPSGRVDRGDFRLVPLNDKTLRNQMAELLRAAGIPKTPGDRLGFHAARRAWADLMHQAEGLETATAAGGWHDAKTLDEVYLSEYRHELQDRARRRMEEEEDDG